MLIYTYGAAYNATPFSQKMADDNFQAILPTRAQKMSLGSGSFDFFRNTNDPPAPFMARKSFVITASTEAALATSVNTMLTNTVGYYREFGTEVPLYLWGLKRGGSASTATDFYHTPAKVVKCNTSSSWKQNGKYMQRVVIEFYCPDGVWYGQYKATNAITAASTVINNTGDYPAQLDVKVRPTGSAITSIKIQNSTTTLTPEWEYSNTILTSEDLYVLATQYSCTVVGATTTDTYEYLALAAASGATTTAWMWVDPGNNTINITPSALGTYQAYFYFTETYVMKY
jgi:hypothetical protein